MRLLLDTHVLLWWIDDDPHLSTRSHAMIGHPDNDVVVSVVSVWEIAIKAGLGRLDVPPDLQGYLRTQLARNQFELLPVRFEHAVAPRDLPLHHRDPFDRMLIVQSQIEQLQLVSRDSRLRAYEIDVIW